eukprot:CAMPEP_0198108054 /NCGR_PEP_ID=MMETSP1442-20131203/147_1 /TAXON_ID= /ORGANISM="Craspedostauros australis, Strain CCMP3328" /LENGTH=44 /DNA_ID= /DNA_START= /DNA_END= /DNA_ORIENTATION=
MKQAMCSRELHSALCDTFTAATHVDVDDDNDDDDDQYADGRGVK